MNKVKIGEKYEVDITSMGHEGEGVGRIDGIAVFVKGALKGERVIIEIEEVHKNYLRGRTVRILKESQHRVNPLCPYADRCGGCSLQHLSYKGQLEYKTQKVKDNLERIGKIYTKVHYAIGMENPLNYRNKGQFVVDEIGKEKITGFYSFHSHEIVPVDNCLIQHPLSNKVVEGVREWLKECDVSVYDRKKGDGLVRHVVPKVAFKTGEVMAIIVANGDDIPCREKLIKTLEEKVAGLKSVILNVNTSRGKMVLGNKNIVIYGKSTIEDFIKDLKFEISPLSFFQVNPVQTEILYDKAIEYTGLTGKEVVIDVYSGIGTISLFAAKKASFVYGIEVVKEAVEDAEKNAQINGVKNVKFVWGKAEREIAKLYKEGVKAEVVIVDPPRDGCDKEVIKAIVGINPKRIVYVSCNPSTLARDLRYLEDAGYRTVEVQPVDMFPYTYHVESVALLQRM
ncbi:23S rRNA (uracil(1939)-C(5))-methyltransferase RlmD [Caldanaerobacter sp.]|uniref:23S rRNA (uracil(1939)-C(5))-methyltransferase RlmD n=1 Tax=Caldanaerobacter sp. TaxID=2930036 RepID=UPI003C70DF25